MVKNPSILIVEDDEAAQFGYEDGLSNRNLKIYSAGTLQEARKSLDSTQVDAVLLDLSLPDGNSLEWIPQLRQTYPNMGIIVITGDADISKAVTSMKSGADNYLTKPVDINELQVALDKCLEIGRLRKRDSVQKRIESQDLTYFGESEAIKALLELATVAAESDSTILLQGETGTGKGVLAKWIHSQSSRNSQPFIELNCSMLRGDLLKSELYGHVKGAFTSAVKDRPGLIEAADGGTLFLDEIGDMDHEVQVQLLKTIEDKSFRRIGENKVRTSDFRLICASNRDLKKGTEDGTFRHDLYYRICVFPIQIPPLRGRIDDIGGLSESILKSLGFCHLPLSKDLIAILEAYHWPGNIRELRNMLERALLLSRKGPIAAIHFPDLDVASFKPTRTFKATKKGEFQTLDELERDYILAALQYYEWDKNKAAKVLGISRSSVYRKIPEFAEREKKN